MSKRPVIGIPWMGYSPFHKFMQSKYIQCLKHAGAKVVKLNPSTKASVIERYVRECDGFLIPGGADIDPQLYGTAKEPACGPLNVVRDSFEYPLLKAVLEAGKPVFSICRGVQLLNVVCGGTLIQDITPIQTCSHSDRAGRTKGTHMVDLADGSDLARIFGKKQIFVNSLHHQVVDQIGEGLRAAAVSPDGFVEALELTEYPSFCLGVQWHPEHMAACSREEQKLFQVFVKACR